MTCLSLLEALDLSVLQNIHAHIPADHSLLVQLSVSLYSGVYIWVVKHVWCSLAGI